MSAEEIVRNWVRGNVNRPETSVWKNPRKDWDRQKDLLDLWHRRDYGRVAEEDND